MTQDTQQRWTIDELLPGGAAALEGRIARLEGIAARIEGHAAAPCARYRAG